MSVIKRRQQKSSVSFNRVRSEFAFPSERKYACPAFAGHVRWEKGSAFYRSYKRLRLRKRKIVPYT